MNSTSTESAATSTSASRSMRRWSPLARRGVTSLVRISQPQTSTPHGPTGCGTAICFGPWYSANCTAANAAHHQRTRRSVAASAVSCSARVGVVGIRLLVGALVAQEGRHEVVEVAVEHALDVADLEPRALVLHLLVRRHHVVTDLVAHRRLRRRPGDGGEGVLALLALEVGELRHEHLHRPRLVLRLTALVLARHHDTGREV